jgi:bacterioferritin
MYKEIVALAQKEGDVTTDFFFIDILKQEEDHHGTFIPLLEQA